MIDERLEEQASLYVLGVLTAGEARSFETMLAGDAELRQLVAALRLSRDALAGSVPGVTPPPSLKERILSRIEAQEKVVPLRASVTARPAGWFTWIPWAIAACLAMLCAYSVHQQGQEREKIIEQTKQLAELNQVADSLRAESADLKLTVASLQETNRLAGVRIAMLNSMLADSPKAVAVSLWDDRQQQGVFLVQNLKPLPADKDYQLWVIDPKYASPVSAGVFQVDAQGNVRLQFKADKPIATAKQFAVTEEPKGGLPTPTLTNLVLSGG